MDRERLILITGATGAVGPLVVETFHDAGYSIRTLSIDPPPVGAWPDDVETLIGDVTDATVVEAAMEGVESVIHLAALLHMVNPAPALKEKYERINVGGTSTVVDAAIRAGVRRVVLFSTIAVYWQSSGRVLHEGTPPQPQTFYGQTKLSAERIVLAARNAFDQPIGTVLRLAAVYGTRIKGNYRRLMMALAKGRFIPIGHGMNRRTLVYDKDVARATALALEHPGAAGKIFNVSDGEFHPLNEIISTICEALGRRPPCLSLPIGPIRFAVDIVEKIARLAGRQAPSMRATIDKYEEDLAVDSQRIQREIGFVPQYDLLSGWRETVREMRQAGELE